MKKVNMNFIPQNVAPMGAKQVAIFDSGGNLVATLPLGGLAHKHQGEKKYSFGALSDVHLPYAEQNASTDFQKALTYFNNVANVDFICISGDMSDAGTDAEWLDYKNHVDAYSPNIPVHLSAGNHDVANGDMSYDYPVQYTGNPLWYSFEQNNDVFIMFGLRKVNGNDVFHNEALQWLYETLEKNKDKRCFVFQHEMRLDGCGNAHGLYGWDGLADRNGQVFLSLMEHYKNVIWFHGHSHTPFRLQSVQPTSIANYDRLHGCHSVHIPSLAVPRYGNSDVIFDAEGYVVDVYENGIHLRGIDFIEEEFVPIASYWIDTTPIEIRANSYVDTRGVINEKTTSLPEGEITNEVAWTMDKRLSSVGDPDKDDEGGMVSDYISVNPGDVINIYGITSLDAKYFYINFYKDETFVYNIALNYGGFNPTDSNYAYAKYSATAQYLTVQIKDVNSVNSLRVSCVASVVTVYRNAEKESNRLVLPEGSELHLNQRFSQSNKGLQDSEGTFSVFIPIDGTKEYTLSVSNVVSGKLNSTSTTLYKLDETKTVATQFNGSGNLISMTTGVTMSEDSKSAVINIPAGNATVHYLALSVPIIYTNLTESDLAGIIITLE